MAYSKAEMLDMIEEAVKDAAEGQFADVEQALRVMASAANYLFSQCEVESGSENSAAD